MQLALERCFAAKEVEEVLIDPLKSNIRAIKFYRSIGFTFVEDRMFGEEECAVYVIDRASWEE
ncbi:MAG: GNAT family N-acetyltransferase, partial [Bacteroidota bacterium]